MQDRLLYGSMRVTILVLITFMAGAACVTAYQALLACFSCEFADAGGRLFAAFVLSVGAALMLRYRGDLIDERAGA
jgi:hypothetical protein